MTGEHAPAPAVSEPLDSRGETDPVRTSAEGRSLIGQGEGISIFAPQVGEALVIVAEAGATYILEFDPALADARVENGALILRFPDGGRIVFENLEDLMIESQAPQLYADGRDVLALLVAQAGLPGTVIEQPQPGETAIYEIVPGERVVLDFDPAAARAGRG